MSPICVPALPMSRFSPPVSSVDSDELDAPRSCGWFESSRELVQGTRVIEHSGFDGLSFDVPLAWQLAACC